MATIEGDETNNSLWGTDEADLMYGLGGNDKLRGGGGADTMFGGTGNDRYWVGSFSAGAGFDIVQESAGEGNDTVFASVSYVLPEHVERLTLLGTDDLDGTGNGADNRLVGNGGQNALYGLGGNDLLDAGKADGLSDLLQGGTGNDRYVVRDAFDFVSEAAGGGRDTVVVLGPYYSNSEHVERVFVRGPEESQVLGWSHGERIVVQGSAATDILGGGGNDLIRGGDGDDILRGDFATPFGPDPVYGVPGNDRLFSGDGSDVLIGGLGDDRLFAEAGDSLLIGGHVEFLSQPLPSDEHFSAGADRYVIKPSGETATVEATIADFSLDDGDWIDLRAVDADPSTPEDDAFVFRGLDGPTGEGGEIWLEDTGQGYRIVGTLADGADAGFSIFLDTQGLDVSQLTEAHFAL
ncbi:MAG: calcium-binding protein [Parasphingopyxis sp.]|nr:hypothetical protein [Sphingomonadales bacterium]